MLGLLMTLIDQKEIKVGFKQKSKKFCLENLNLLYKELVPLQVISQHLMVTWTQNSQIK